jgi:4-aminobutyrate aminotransferase-like enzyme
VACTIGLTVLDVLRREKLPENAKTTGEYLRSKLRELQAKYPFIGDVRGNGLFVGVELVEDRESKTPYSGEKTETIVNALKEAGVLLGSTGKSSNVLKVRPPMCFSREDADFLVGRFEEVFGACK